MKNGWRNPKKLPEVDLTIFFWGKKRLGGTKHAKESKVDLMGWKHQIMSRMAGIGHFRNLEYGLIWYSSSILGSYYIPIDTNQIIMDMSHRYKIPIEI